jgi:hypothetical protein
VLWPDHCIQGTAGAEISTSSATVTITNDDVQSLVAVAVGDGAGAEAASDPITFTITRSENLASGLSVNLQWGGTASFGTDYTVTTSAGTLAANGSTITFAAGESSATLTVTPVDDAVVEPSESVVLTVAAGAGYAPDSSNSASGSIADNDSAAGQATLTVSATDAAGAEGGKNTISFVVNRATNTTGALIVNLQWSGAAVYGTDYTVTASAGTLAADGSTITFTDRQRSVTLTVAPIDDAAVEVAESVVLTIAGGAGYAVGSPSSATGSIADNDVAALPSLSV